MQGQARLCNEMQCKERPGTARRRRARLAKARERPSRGPRASISERRKRRHKKTREKKYKFSDKSCTRREQTSYCSSSGHRGSQCTRPARKNIARQLVLENWRSPYSMDSTQRTHITYSSMTSHRRSALGTSKICCAHAQKAATSSRKFPLAPPLYRYEESPGRTGPDSVGHNSHSLPGSCSTRTSFQIWTLHLKKACLFLLQTPFWEEKQIQALHKKSIKGCLVCFI